MQYTINKTNYKTFSVYEKNKRPARSYFVPFSSREAVPREQIHRERYVSDRILLLSGEWDFAYYERFSLLPSELDTQKLPFSKIPVPSTWQRTGYEPPYYLNTRYQFPLDPPNFPEDVPVGVYRKVFTLADTDNTYFLNFLGAISSLDVYLNGHYVGYSEGAHNTAEFDVSAYLKQGENELLCVVCKWATATYLECQDMFRENGIFRDVYLIQTEDTFLDDFTVKTDCRSGVYSMALSACFSGGTGAEYHITLEKDGELLSESRGAAAPDVAIHFPNLPVQEWSAELPNLYELWISITKDGRTLECVRTLVGFRQIEIQKDVFRFNGAKIKMKGVNHHDTTLKTGYVMTAEELEQDVRLMKEYNVNTVRTSHYPPDPMFLTLCDQYGLYVIDEADIETHGCGEGEGKGAIDQISHNPEWAGHYLDRVGRMYGRDKNHPSITMWSLGNESGGYYCQDRCYEWLKERCPDIPIHYEAVSRTKRWAYDVVSEMYMPVEKLYAISKGVMGPKFNKKPYFLCEYAHAMGVGPGGLEDYMIRFYKSDRLLGGCIWEWADHAAYHEEGPYRYTYGGDHGEALHDGNFCVDGLFYPDRRPHTGAMEMKVSYRPVRAFYHGKNRFSFWNTNAFRSTDYIRTLWEFYQDGKRVCGGELPLNLSAGQRKKVSIEDITVDTGKDNLIHFVYIDRDTQRTIAKEQVDLLTIVKELPLSRETQASYQEDGNTVTVSFAGGTLVFDKSSGRMDSYRLHGKEYLNQFPAGGAKGLELQLFRAPLDNDRNIKTLWETLGYPDLKAQLAVFQVQPYGRGVRVCSKYNVKSPKKGLLFLACVTCVIDGEGTVEVDAALSRIHPGAVSLPRFGLHLEMPETMRHVTYFGRGDAENLSDMKVHALAGIYRAEVNEMHEPYIKPQDSGCHTDTRWCMVTDDEGDGLLFVNRGRFFSFQAHPYVTSHLAAAEHMEEVTGQATTDVSIDGFYRGSGSNSCGPVPTIRHRISMAKPLRFQFTMKPVARKKE